MVAGFAVALDGLDRSPSSFTGGRFWGFLFPVHLSFVSGCLLLAMAALLDGDRRRPDWALGAAVLGIVVAVAFALKAADARVIWGRGEDGFWGALYSLVSMMPFALLLALPSLDRGRPLGGPSTWGVAAGVAVTLAAIGVGIHAAGQDPFGGFWSFFNAALTPFALGSLLVMTSLPLDTPTRFLRPSAGAVAAVVLIAGTGYVIDFVGQFDLEEVEWFVISNVSARVALALLILAAIGATRVQFVLPVAFLTGLAATAYSIRMMTAGDVDFNLVIFVYIVLNGLVIPMLAVLCASIGGDRSGERGQLSESASPSAVP